MVLAKFCCQAMCNFCSRRKILKEKKKALEMLSSEILFDIHITSLW